MILLPWLALLLTPVAAYLHVGPLSQTPFTLEQTHSDFQLDSNPATQPNIHTRLEITSNGSAGLYCGRPGDEFNAGYAHFTNSEGVEDKHMFWWLFKARHDPENAPLIVTFGGGPGASGLLFPFSGAGPCVVQTDKQGRGEAVPAPHSWTEYANVLAIDQPVGVGFSYGQSLRNSGATTAWDVDDLLQAFWAQVEYPHLVKNQFMISSGSYGGIFMPHVINTIHSRNHDLDEAVRVNRTIKMPESIMLANAWSDAQSHFLWFHQSNCIDNPFFNATICNDIVDALPGCLNAIQYAYEQSTPTNRYAAFEECTERVAPWEHATRNIYDYREKCPAGGCDMNLGPVEDVLNSSRIKAAVGVPHDRKFLIMAVDEITMPFVYNGDYIQPAYLLLGPAIAEGLRVLLYNGMKDGAVPWRSNLAWMRLLKSPHQSAFRNATEEEYPGVGTILKAGAGPAGEFTLVKIEEAGHMVVRTRPELLQHLMAQWLQKKPFY
ncbi:Alpha/beta-hydrolase [Mycena venus]|uniref:Alpha/beta-hydrolase n=1 Tax=Mycena venus TaxID=2733690 RepID=A0A8H6YP51_9AGAR|nr:Alpha/beta-hydrolase [Mycena venus]